MFKILAQFEGVVLNYNDNIINTQLLDLTSKEEFEADIIISKIKPKERAYIDKGAIFKWTIGYSWKSIFSLKPESVIIFNKEVWTQNEINQAKIEAKRLYDLFNK